MKSVKLLSVIGTLASLAMLAGAQTSPKQGDADKLPPAKAAPSVWLASDLIGMKVVTPQAEKIGKIEDVVVHPGGEVAYAVLSFGGVMGLGDKLFAMPWTVLRAVEPDTAKKDSERSLVLPLDKERMKTAPGFDKGNWPIMANADWSKDIDAYYADARRPDAKKPVEAAARTSVITWKCTDLKGVDVKMPTGESLGDIKEVAVDTSGRVSYVVLSVGGFLGIGDRLVAVPWDALKFSLAGDKGDKKLITLATTKQQLEQAPQFKPGKDKLPEMTDPKWITSVPRLGLS
jgi:sporulation protein YlmC with PRC-barrel domain